MHVINILYNDYKTVVQLRFLADSGLQPRKVPCLNFVNDMSDVDIERQSKYSSVALASISSSVHRFGLLLQSQPRPSLIP